ncbi:MAG: HAMP domain-containing histidine kinase [Calothrix sp. SM1_5_4]|nr:HAMP domain-containing histidine kinase [Calothrix sp. SM1_5_4]
MSSIRLRLFLLLSFFAGTTLGLSFAASRTFMNFRSESHRLEDSHAVRGGVQDLTSMKNGSEDFRRLFDELSARTASLHPPRRGQELKEFLRAVADGKPYRERQQVLIKNEAEFQRYTRAQLEYLERRMAYFAGLAVASLIAGFIALHIFVQRSVLRPVRDLSRKMTDFLNERYTYQFSVPSADEVGRMHATFNSLAQRVIANMAELKTLDQAKSEFLSIASHELRTPLTSIKGSLSLMRSGIVGAMNEMADNLLTIAENETDRLIRLINDILDLAKIEARKLPLQQSWGSLNQLVKTCLQSLEGLAQQADVRLEAGAIPSLEVYMDSDRVQQILTNLLSNAIKFSPKGKCVTVHCEVTAKKPAADRSARPGATASPPRTRRPSSKNSARPRIQEILWSRAPVWDWPSRARWSKSTAARSESAPFPAKAAPSGSPWESGATAATPARKVRRRREFRGSAEIPSGRIPDIPPRQGHAHPRPGRKRRLARTARELP